MSKLVHEKADRLFPSDEEGSIDGADNEKQRKSSSKKRPSRPPTLPGHAAPKKIKTRIIPVTRPTARDLFGTDSENDDEDIAPPPATTSVPTSTQPHSDKGREFEKLNTYCLKCQVMIPKNEYRYHLRTNLHKSNCLLNFESEHIYIIGCAFKNRIVTYRLNPAQEVEYITPHAFLKDNQTDIFKLINISLTKNTCIKLNFELFAYFVLPQTGEQQLKSFNSKYKTVCMNTDLNDLFSETLETFDRKLTEFYHCKSGWSYLSISHLEMNVNKYNPMRGGTYIPLPSKITKSKSCLNIKNKDNNCFLWCIIAALFPTKSNACRTSSYPHYANILNTNNMSMPAAFCDIKMFELNNPTISVNIYGIDERCNVTGPLYLSISKKPNHINLLYIEKKNIGHYCLIKDLKRLVKHQLTKSKSKLYFCDACIQFFTGKSKYDTHSCSKVLLELPHSDSKIQFKHYERKQKIKFVIYADFESLLLNCSKSCSENTHIYKLHQPSSFAYYICCAHDSSLNKYVAYRGLDCVKVFIEWLIKDVMLINDILNDKKPMSPLTKEQENEFRNATTCYICKNLLFDDRVIDHDHETSFFRGIAHSYCNLLLKTCNFVPIIFHNLCNYDCHLFIKELTKYEGDIKVIPKNKEKYLSITKFITRQSSTKSIQMKFIDSFQFLSCSLDELSKNLAVEEFNHLLNEFRDKEKFDLLKHKGPYPYDYMDSWLKYDENKLPEKPKFYNSLKQQDISDIEYERAQKIWQVFNIHTLGEYTDLYLKCDVLLLCDIYENFRTNSLRYYNLDPAYYVSAPGLSWDAMLLYTGVQLDMIDDLEMYEMLEKGIRGGLAQCSLRYAKANNKFLPDHDESKPESYLIYLDCNNLYGFSMMQKLPMSDFRFLTKKEISKFNVMNVDDDGYLGYILEVDMFYPDHLHDLHSDLPFAVEKFVPPGGKTTKLIANLYDKYKYVIHITHLKECLRQGLILKNINRIICFRQERYLKKYIDLNTKLRQDATSNFQRDFFKLLNNSIFGKTIENKRKQVNVKLVTKWKDCSNTTNKHIGAEQLLSKPNLKNVTIFSDDFVAIQLKPEKIILDKPIYIGFTVLELAKHHLYKFHYNYIKNKYKDKATLCYTDTDSLLYLFESSNIYDDIKKDNNSIYDTSNFSMTNPYNISLLNAKIPGLFKDELGGDVISEFIGLRAKLYCIRSIKTKVVKAKGISKCVTKQLQISDYNESLKFNTSLKCKMNLIKSIKHVLYSQEVNKVVLNSKDDKRQILSNHINTLPWGHCDTIF